MIVVEYINKKPHVICEVSSVAEFYDKFMKKNRVSDLNEWIQENENDGIHVITKHSSNIGKFLTLIKTT